MQFIGLFLFFKRLAMVMSSSRSCPNGERCYSGKYQDGHAVYFYDDTDEGRIYAGKFWFRRVYYALPKARVTEIACGLFGNGKKEGRWTFTYRGYGVSRKLAAEYSEGHRSGFYNYRSVCRARSLGFTKGVTTLSVTFRNGHIEGTVSCMLNNETLTGSYDSEGRPDGKWTMNAATSHSHRICHETWVHGECMSFDATDVTTGDKTDMKTHLPDILMSIFYNECKPLEAIMKRGS